jgi:class 3 adenylate cyclase/tetratricopeptide (TPR) repeat protein
MRRCPSCGNLNREEARFCDFCGTRLDEVAAAPPPGRTPAAADAPLPPDAPREVAGRYRIERFLGRGGRKNVFLARDAQASDREVAVAVFDTEGVEETVLARARREAQAMAKLGEHPHIVSVLDSGEEAGVPFIVSEYMPAGDVGSLLESSPGRRLDVEQALGIAIDVCRALEHAHARGIVHRDLKPANVWLDASGSARLGDFGLATTDRRSRAAVEGMLVGTVAYLPPEQALGRSSDARADLYSLGAMLYEMLTGEPPFPGDDAVAIISQHLNAAPVAPSHHRAELPSSLDEPILRLLAKAPDDRPDGAAVARRELDAAAKAPPEEFPAPDESENPLERLAGGVFVGRERELEEMRALLEDALSGRGHLLLLTGEPGIGKTRTAEELATYAQVRGAQVHWGRCHEADGAPAYWPWSEAIRSYVRDADPVGLAWQLGREAAEVAQIVPELREVLGEVEDLPELEPEQARFRLFDSVGTFLRGASQARPLVIILDDLHWADEPSLLMLRFIARQIGDSGLVLVGTYRDVELGRHHPLAETLSDLAGIEHGRRVGLRGLDVEAVGRYVQMTTGSGPPPGLADAVRDQTAGNPFFVAEVVRLMASEGRLGPAAGDAGWELAIPQGVREVVGRRLDQLSEHANEVLRFAAVCGREFYLEVLDRVCGRPREEIVGVIEQAVGARLVTESQREPGRYSFAHALVRDTLYAEVPTSQRLQVNREIAEALEQINADDLDSHVSELAHHFLEAASPGETGRAVDYAQRAARRATAGLAHEEAASLYRKALDALELEPSPDPETRFDLLLELGDAQIRAGRLADARATLDRAAPEARTLGDPDRLARVALSMTLTSEAGVVDEPQIALLEEALAAIGEDDSAVRSQLLSGLAQALYWIDAAGRSNDLGLESLEMARRVGDPEALATALTRRQFTTGVGIEATHQRLAESEEMHDLAKRLGDLELELRAHVYRLRDFLELGNIPEVDRNLAAYERLARELRQPQFLWHIPLLRGTRALIDGRFSDAEQLMAEARAGGERAQEPVSAMFFVIQDLLLRRHRGSDADREHIRELLPGLGELVERYPTIPAWRCSLASIHAELGNQGEARTVFEQLAGEGFESLPSDAQWLISLTSLGETAAFLGDAARAGRLYELIQPYSGMTIVAGRAAACYGPVERVLGLLAATIGRTSDAERHLGSSLALSERMGDRPFVARTCRELAEVLLARDGSGDRERALELLARALEIAQGLGMQRLVTEVLTLRLEAQGLTSLDATTSIDYMIEAVSSERPDIASYAAPDGTVTILFSDIEDSTQITERLGDERWLEVLRAHNSLFRRVVRGHDGFEVKNQGDGFMLVFGDPRRALECAVAVQRELADAELGEGERIRVRMGMHSGEAIREEGDFFGRSVILAARIAAHARGGEVLVSEALKEQAESSGSRGAPPVSFDAGRDLELKGLAGTHRVYRADWEAVPAG